MSYKIILGVTIALLLVMSIVNSGGIIPPNPEDRADNQRESISPTWIQWDVDGDNNVDMDDLNFLINYLYINGAPAPDPVLRADFNDNGEVTLGDVMFLVNHLIEIGVIIPDKNKPVITLLNPDEDDVFKTSEDDKKIKFEFKIADESIIDYCELKINGDVERTIDNPEKDVVIEITLKLDIDDYDWEVSCVDIYGNKGDSEEREFEVEEREVEDENNIIDDTSYNTQDNIDLSTLYTDQEAISTQPVQSEDGFSFDLKFWIVVLFVLLILITTTLIVVYSRR